MRAEHRRLRQGRHPFVSQRRPPLQIGRLQLVPPARTAPGATPPRHRLGPAHAPAVSVANLGMAGCRRTHLRATDGQSGRSIHGTCAFCARGSPFCGANPQPFWNPDELGAKATPRDGTQGACWMGANGCRKAASRGDDGSSRALSRTRDEVRGPGQAATLCSAAAISTSGVCLQQSHRNASDVRVLGSVASSMLCSRRCVRSESSSR